MHACNTRTHANGAQQYKRSTLLLRNNFTAQLHLYDTIIYTRTLISVHRTMTNKIHVCKHFYTALPVHRTQNNHFDRKQHYPCRQRHENMDSVYITTLPDSIYITTSDQIGAIAIRAMNSYTHNAPCNSPRHSSYSHMYVQNNRRHSNYEKQNIAAYKSFTRYPLRDALAVNAVQK